jgi:DNA-binding PadR family transcriptional regulator
MDVQTLCLAVLAHGPASGYEIKKELEEGAYSHFFRASFGSIYPALARLAGAGLVSGREQEQAKRPDKKVYKLTAAGRRDLARRLQGPVGPDYVRSEFLLALFHADLLAPRRRRELIADRIAALKDCLARMDKDAATAPEQCRYEGIGPAFVCGYGHAILTAELDYLERNRARLEMTEASAA